VLASGDPDDAARFEAPDDTMDRLHRELLTAVLAEDEHSSKAVVVDVTLLAAITSGSPITPWKSRDEPSSWPLGVRPKSGRFNTAAGEQLSGAQKTAA
jgi:hypothetical protein